MGSPSSHLNLDDHIDFESALTAKMMEHLAEGKDQRHYHDTAFEGYGRSSEPANDLDSNDHVLHGLRGVEPLFRAGTVLASADGPTDPDVRALAHPVPRPTDSPSAMVPEAIRSSYGDM